jgi:Na+/H+-dicarboxylate symporter
MKWAIDQAIDKFIDIMRDIAALIIVLIPVVFFTFLLGIPGFLIVKAHTTFWTFSIYLIIIPFISLTIYSFFENDHSTSSGRFNENS